MTEFKVNAAEDGKPATLKVPLALIAPIYSIAACVIGFGFNMYSTQRDQGQAIAVMARDVSTLKGSTSNIERTLGVYSDSAYTIGDATRDQSAIKNELADHENRLRALEKRRR